MVFGGKKYFKIEWNQFRSSKRVKGLRPVIHKTLRHKEVLIVPLSQNASQDAVKSVGDRGLSPL